MMTIQRLADGYTVHQQNALSSSTELYRGPSAVGALYWALANASADEEFEIGGAVRRELCETLRELLCGAEAERADDKPPSREAVVSYLKAQRDMQADRWSRFIELIERAEHSGD